MARHGYLQLADGWVRREASGLGPFVSREVLRRSDGVEVVWESRRHRKRRPHPSGSTWWAPGALGWWIGTLFAAGSLCFALGALPPYAESVGRGTDNVTFFVGSLFFTTAATLQYLQVGGTDLPGPTAGGRVRLLAWVRPRVGRIDWWAAAVQLVGTVFFNVSTYHALSAPSSAANVLVWRPDVFGSVCFLVSSWLSWGEVCHGPVAVRTGELSWWIILLNLIGSVAFGVSALASKTVASGELRSVALTNLGTLVGALCFLAGGLLLLPERTEGSDEEAQLLAAAGVPDRLRR